MKILSLIVILDCKACDQNSAKLPSYSMHVMSLSDPPLQRLIWMSPNVLITHLQPHDHCHKPTRPETEDSGKQAQVDGSEWGILYPHTRSLRYPELLHLKA